MKLIFCMQINIKVSYKLISTLWVSKISARWYYHYWWALSSIFKVLKVTSLQYLYNIWEKNWLIPFRSYGTLKWSAVTNDLMNQADWLNNFCTGLTTSLLCIFDICWVSTAVVLVTNDVLFVVPTGKNLELGFPKCFLIKGWLSVERLFSFEKIWEMTKHLGAHPAWLLKITKILAFLLYGYHSPQLKNIAIPASCCFLTPQFQTFTNLLIWIFGV